MCLHGSVKLPNPSESNIKWVCGEKVAGCKVYCPNCEGWYDRYLYQPMPEISGVHIRRADDLAEIDAAIMVAGFRSPAVTHFKPDPRGQEYGYFEVSIADSDNILVKHHMPTDPCASDRPLSYEIRFRNVEMFRRWASANT